MRLLTWTVGSRAGPVNPSAGSRRVCFDNRYHLSDSGMRILGKSLQQQQLRSQDRLIVALDVPTHDRAFELVDLLDNVGFFKVGLELLLAGDLLRFLQRLRDQKRQNAGVFVDLKLGGDIGNTIASLVRQLQALNVKFLTLIESVPLAITLNSVKAAREARGPASDPQLLIVPCLSTMDQEELRESGINT